MDVDTGQTQAESVIMAMLRFTQRRIRLVALGVGLLTWLVAILTCLLAFVLADHLVRDGVPPTLGLIARLAVLALSAVWLTVSCFRPLMRRMNDLYAAWLIERAHPEFKNSVVGAVQLGHRVELPGSTRDALERRAALDLTGVDVSACVSARPLRRVLKMAGVVTAAFFLYAMFSPKQVFPSIQRAFGWDVPAPTLTRIVEMLPDADASVLRGEPVEFSVRLAGRAPADTTVRFSFDQGLTWLEGQELPLAVRGEEATGPRPKWRGVKAGTDVQRTMWWQVLAGDARSPVRRLHVRPQPNVVAISTRYTFPGYTGLAPTSQPTGDIDAPVGTRVSIEADTNVPAFDPILVVGEPPRDRRHLLAAPGADEPQRIRGQLIVRENTTYLVTFRDGWRTPSPTPIRYRIHARPDLAPSIEIRQPATGMEFLPADKLPLSFHAEDDYGLSRAALIYRGGRQRQEDRLDLELPSGRRTVSLDLGVPLDTMKAEAGDLIEWRLRVWDNREDDEGRATPQYTDSEIRTVRIRATPQPGEPSPPLAAGAGDSSPPTSESQAEAPAEGPVDEAAASSPAETALTDEPDDAEETLAAEQPQPEERQEEAPGKADSGSLEEFAKAHARELEVLAQHMDAELPSPPGNEEPAQDEHETPLPGETGTTGGAEPAAASRKPGQSSGSARPSTEGSDVALAEADDQPRDGEVVTADPRDETGSATTQSAARQGQPSSPVSGSEEPASGQPAEGNAANERKGPGPMPGESGENNQDREETPGSSGDDDRPQEASATEQDEPVLELPAGESERSETDQGVLPGPRSAAESTFQSPGEDDAGSEADDRSNDAGAESDGTGEMASNGGSERSAAPRALEDALEGSDEEGLLDAGDDGEGSEQDSESGTAGTPPDSASSGEPGPGRQPVTGNAASETGATPGEGDDSEDGEASSEEGSSGSGDSPGTGQNGRQPGQGGQQPGPGQGSTEGSPGNGQGDAPPESPAGESDMPGASGSPSGDAAGQPGSGGQSSPSKPSGTRADPQGSESAAGQADPKHTSGAGAGGGAISRTGPPVELPETPAAPTHEPGMPVPPGDQPATDGPGLRVKALVDQLDMALRRGEVDETLLSALGWDVPRAEQFVDAYKRAAAAGQVQSDRTVIPVREQAVLAAPEPAPAKRAGRAASGRRLDADQDRPSDDTRELIGVGRQRVTPRYRGLLEAYYQSMTTQPAR